MKSWQRYAGVFLLAVAGLVIQQSVWVLRLIDHGQPGSGFMPFGLGVILAVLAICLIATNLGPEEQARFPSGSPRRGSIRSSPSSSRRSTRSSSTTSARSRASWSWSPAGCSWSSTRACVVSAATGLATGLVVYLVFDRFLQTPFPRGLLF